MRRGERTGAHRSLVWGALALASMVASGSGGCRDDGAADPSGTEGTSEGSTGATSGVEQTASTDAGMVDVDAPTWYQDVAPTVIAKCGGCHREGGVAPFPLTDYASAASWAPILVEAVESGRMPPFAAADTDECEMQHGWKDDLRLSDEEKQALRDWADAEAPEGDPATAAPVPEAPSVELTTSDLHLQMAGSVTIGGDRDRFLCFSLDPQLTEDRYLQALQVVPGNDEIVHHVLIYVDEEADTADQGGSDGWFECSGGAIQGDLIGAWAPGALPARTPEGAGMRVPAGSRLVMNVHYHPTGAGDEVDDATGIDIDWLDEIPAWRAELVLIGNGTGLQPGPNDDGLTQFLIPPDVSDHTETMLFELPAEVPELRLWGIGAHMHYVGVDMLIGVQRQTSPGPERECLLQTPTYDFEWQRLYTYDNTLDDAIRLAGGDSLYMRCTYDNTLGNPAVAEALGQQGLEEPVEVRLGEETLDEMCLGIYGIAVPSIF